MANFYFYFFLKKTYVSIFVCGRMAEQTYIGITWVLVVLAYNNANHRIWSRNYLVKEFFYLFDTKILTNFCTGIATVSMCIQLVNEQIVLKVESLPRTFGLRSTDDQVDLIKVSKSDRLRETPKGLTGNELDFNAKRRKLNQGSIL